LKKESHNFKQYGKKQIKYLLIAKSSDLEINYFVQ